MAWVTVAAVAGVAGTVMSGVGAYEQGQAQANSAQYNAEVAQQNAQIATQQGEAAAQEQSRVAQRKIGAQVAAYGASGVDGSSGSPMDVLADSVRMATLDQLTTKYNYQLKAIGYQNQVGLDQANAENSSTAGTVAAIGGTLKGFGSAIPKF
jgi:hypothetical protein